MATSNNNKEEIKQTEESKFAEDQAFNFEEGEKQWKNRQRTLIVCSRGISQTYRHLMKDLIDLIPQCKKEAKMDRKSAAGTIDEMCYMRSCNNCIYLECRKRKDLFMWLVRSPGGPSAKFHLQNVNTTEELKLTGNCLKGSRPLLSFDKAFDELPHLRLIKEMLTHSFGTPKNHPKSKPFIDHVLSFNFFNDRIWFRNYQIVNESNGKFTEDDDIDKLNMIEIGPRFSMRTIRIFDDSMGGQTLWENPFYLSPTKLRSKKFGNYARRTEEKQLRTTYKQGLEKETEGEDHLEIFE